MSDESTGGAPKKLSTKDILAAARAEALKKAGASAAPAEPAPAEPAATESAPAAEPVVAEQTAAEQAAPEVAAKPAATKATGGAKPKSTADILAAARAQATGGAAPAASATASASAAASASATPAKPAAAGGAKPKSTADILAAARAAKGAGAAPAGEKPAPQAKPKPVAAAAEADAGGPKLSVAEMLAAVRPAAEGGAAEATATPVKPIGAPPMPAKPLPAAKKGAAKPEIRRNILVALLLSPFALAWTLMAATSTVFALATARFMMPNVLTEPPRKFKIGSPTDFDLGTVATKLVAQYGVWIVHTDQYKGKNMIYALISVCTHLGCTPSWLEGEQKFKCPCHGSGFYITGINFEGPAPRPLERAGIRLAPDGMLEVDKSLKFQEEMGQWSDPASFYEVVG
jgi:cytochrome b6-f complex iron-sulfur subunit